MTLTPASEALRATRIGASEVAALLPCGHPYMTAGDIYVRLIHGATRPSNTAMAMGNLLEEAVLREGSRMLGIRPRRNSRTWVHPTLPLAATPDAFVSGRPELVEVKVVSHWQTDAWQDGPPEYVHAQVQAQMLVTGREACHVVALLEGSRIVVKTLTASPVAHGSIERAVAAFERDHLIPCIPPQEATEDDWALTVTGLEGTVYADGDLLAYGEHLADLTAAEKAATKAKDEARGAMALAMAAAGASVVVAPEWRAEAKPAATGKVSLWFYPRKERAA